MRRFATRAPLDPAAHDTQRGAVALSVSLSMAIVLGMVVASVVLGRKSVARRELQSAADAAALAAAYSVQQNGLPLRDNPARPFAVRNTVLPTTPAFSVVTRPGNENRVLVQVNLLGSFDSEQSWFQRMFQIPVTSYAQVNEQVFGATWPALLIVLDASKSMEQPIIGSAGTSTWQVLRQVITAYASNTLPVRNGVVIYNRVVVAQAPPPATKVNNLQAITSALAKATALQNGTNTRTGLRRAGQLLDPLTADRNAMLITDGEPTLGGPCAEGEICHYSAAETAARDLRNISKAALFSVEIRRTNFSQEMQDFMQGIAGMPGSNGNDPNMYFVVQSVLGVTQLLIGVTGGLCAFGPLTPGPGSAPDQYRIRGSIPDLVGPPQRIYGYFRESNGTETSIPLVADRVASYNQPGFEYVVEPDGAYVVLTLRSCNYLGADANRRVVVRWDEAQLSPPP